MTRLTKQAHGHQLVAREVAIRIGVGHGVDALLELLHMTVFLRPRRPLRMRRIDTSWERRVYTIATCAAA